MRTMSPDERMFWRSQTCRVWVGYAESGGLVLRGEDRDDYEYEVTVAPDQFGDLRAALRGEPGEDLVDLVCRRVDDIMSMGEARWLAAHNVSHRVTTW